MFDKSNVFENQNYCAGLIIKCQLDMISFFERIDLKLTAFENVAQNFEDDYAGLGVKLKKIHTFLNDGTPDVFSTSKNETKKKRKDGGVKKRKFKKSLARCQINEELTEMQKTFNKYIKSQVKKEFGESYLATHQVRELDFEIMQHVKKTAIERFLPKDVSPKEAWLIAMNSLRQMRHQKKKKSSYRLRSRD